jgi:ABC-type sulfate transport system permease component
MDAGKDAAWPNKFGHGTPSSPVSATETVRFLAVNALSEPERPRAEWPFLAMLTIVGGSYVVLIVVLLAADVGYLIENAGRPATWPAAIADFLSPEIVYATLLSLISCCITAILSVWVAVPLGYLLSRVHFPGKAIVDAIVDIPIVLPPLVIGLSLLIFFQTRAGKAIEYLTQEQMGTLIAYVALPLTILAAAAVLCRLIGVNGGTAVGNALRGVPGAGEDGRGLSPRNATEGVPYRIVRFCKRYLSPFVLLYVVPVALAGASLVVLLCTRWGTSLSGWGQRRLATEITYAVPSVILAQFSVACAFAVRTMRVTFDQITPRREQVARTLGCSRSQAFWLVALPEAWHGIVTAATIAWARALGEFGPVLVFSGATRRRTEVLPTTIFLELSVGSLGTAVAVSLAMVVVAVAVLVVVRVWGRWAGYQPL